VLRRVLRGFGDLRVIKENRRRAFLKTIKSRSQKGGGHLNGDRKKRLLAKRQQSGLPRWDSGRWEKGWEMIGVQTEYTCPN